MTTLLTTSADDLELAAALLLQGEAVVFPTDTVYGVGVIPWRPEPIARLYQIKERPLQKGLPILLSDDTQLEKVVAGTLSATARQLMARYWPGPLTLVLPRRTDLPANLSPNDGIAVRVPDSDVARTLIGLAGGALATSSANLSGRPALTDAGCAAEQLDGRVAAVIDGGPAPYEMASTIVDCRTSPPRLLRAGPIELEDGVVC